MKWQRTANSVLTVCLTKRDNRNILCGSVSKESDFHLGLTPSVRREVLEDKGQHANGKEETPNHNNINGRNSRKIRV